MRSSRVWVQKETKREPKTESLTSEHEDIGVQGKPQEWMEKEQAGC